MVIIGIRMYTSLIKNIFRISYDFEGNYDPIHVTFGSIM